MVVFQHEPTANVLFIFKLAKIKLWLEVLETTEISLEDLINPGSKLPVEKWFDFILSSGGIGSKPTILRLALSLTCPTASPFKLCMVRSRPFSNTSRNARSWKSMVNEADNELISIQMRLPTLRQIYHKNCYSWCYHENLLDFYQ